MILNVKTISGFNGWRVSLEAVSKVRQLLFLCEILAIYYHVFIVSYGSMNRLN